MERLSGEAKHGFLDNVAISQSIYDGAQISSISDNIKKSTEDTDQTTGNSDIK